MQVPEAKGHINIELDKVLGFFFFLFMFYVFSPLTLQQRPQVRGKHLLQKVAAPLWEICKKVFF